MAGLDDPLTPFGPRRSWSRILSLVVVLGYLVVAMVLDEPRMAFYALTSSVPCVLCIWHPGAMADWIARMSSSSSSFEPSERVIVVLAWIALLLPVWVGLLAAVMST
jgi:hypothetical protein